MGKSTPDGELRTGPGDLPGGFGAAFDRRDTTFLRAVDALEDLLRQPPTGPNGYRLLLGGINELQGILLRGLPLRTAREAAAAQTVSLCQLVDDAASLRLGEAVTVFIAMLQREAERIGLAAGPSPPDSGDRDGRLLALEVEYAALPSDHGKAEVARAIAEAEAGTVRGALVKLRLLRRATGCAWADEALLDRLAATAVEGLERHLLIEDARQFDAAAQAFAAAPPAPPPPVLPATPTEGMIAAGASAGKVAVDAARRMYDAMVAAFLAPPKDARK
ncbi:hypothetical protein [Azospirillum sp.]|uniref:hypothetical protein n=1 Tax=Azospirillum sp. TaxID=34012 RepID=UPI002D53D23D|nr:hypothetical protein [Azospirillum sp.]HYD65548.1 hypothetical protein [Azospirillum sp.]